MRRTANSWVLLLAIVGLVSGMVAQAIARATPVGALAGMASADLAMEAGAEGSSPEPVETELRSEVCKPRHRDRQLEMRVAGAERPAMPANVPPALLEQLWHDCTRQADAGQDAATSRQHDAAAGHHRTPRLQLKLQLGQAP